EEAPRHLDERGLLVQREERPLDGGVPRACVELCPDRDGPLPRGEASRAVGPSPLPAERRPAQLFACSSACSARFLARLRSFSSRRILRMRSDLGVTSTSSSSSMYSRHSSSERTFLGATTSLRSEPEARMFESFFVLVGLTVMSMPRQC